MRHTYRCQLRWADMDSLQHINNVIYVDYLQEARIDMLRTHAIDLRAGDLAEGAVVVRNEVSYLAPLTFRLTPVTIECWVTELRAASFTMAYEVFDEADDGARTVYLRATTEVAPYVFAEERPRRLTAGERSALERFLEPAEARPRVPFASEHASERGRYDLAVRFSDVDAYRHVNNVKYFEYFQEARIVYMIDLARDLPGPREEMPMVIAQMDVDYLKPLVFREEPYTVRSWIERVGTSSLTVSSEITDGQTPMARARVVMVSFDPATQRAAPTPAHLRELMERHQSG